MEDELDNLDFDAALVAVQTAQELEQTATQELADNDCGDSCKI